MEHISTECEMKTKHLNVDNSSRLIEKQNKQTNEKTHKESCYYLMSEIHTSERAAAAVQASKWKPQTRRHV